MVTVARSRRTVTGLTVAVDSDGGVRRSDTVTVIRGRVTAADASDQAGSTGAGRSYPRDRDRRRCVTVPRLAAVPSRRRTAAALRLS